MREEIAREIPDDRESAKVKHEIEDLVRHRVFAIANGCVEGNDAAKIGHDPVLKMACGRRPVSDEPLSSQPSISRFENAVGPRTLYGISKTIARKVLSNQKSRRKGKQAPKVITIDMDPSCDPTHGGQQQTCLDAYYDTYCYLPQVITIAFDDEPRQCAIGAILGRATKGRPTAR